MVVIVKTVATICFCNYRFSPKGTSNPDKEAIIKDYNTNWAQNGLANGFATAGADLINAITQRPVGINPNVKNIIPAIVVTSDTPISEKSKLSYGLGNIAGNLAFQVLMGAGLDGLGTLGSSTTAIDRTISGGIDFTPISEAPQKVIGHYPEYVDMSNKLGVKPFSIPDSAWNKMTIQEQWAANQKFLDRAIAKGSEFNLATPIDKIRPNSYLVKEIQYLNSQGYNLTSDGTKFIK